MSSCREVPLARALPQLARRRPTIGRLIVAVVPLPACREPVASRTTPSAACPSTPAKRCNGQEGPQSRGRAQCRHSCPLARLAPAPQLPLPGLVRPPPGQPTAAAGQAQRTHRTIDRRSWHGAVFLLLARCTAPVSPTTPRQPASTAYSNGHSSSSSSSSSSTTASAKAILSRPAGCEGRSARTVGSALGPADERGRKEGDGANGPRRQAHRLPGLRDSARTRCVGECAGQAVSTTRAPRRLPLPVVPLRAPPPCSASPGRPSSTRARRLGRSTRETSTCVRAHDEARTARSAAGAGARLLRARGPCRRPRERARGARRSAILAQSFATSTAMQDRAVEL